jgi:Protein of unknown function (DUF1579)
MKRGSVVVPLAVFVLATAVVAQNPPQPPKPSPELKRLNYWVGNWTTEFEMKPGPFGPRGKTTGKVHEEWLPGGFFVVARANWTGAMGDSTELSVMGYSADEKVYTYNDFNGRGGSAVFEGHGERGHLDLHKHGEDGGQENEQPFHRQGTLHDFVLVQV